MSSTKDLQFFVFLPFSLSSLFQNSLLQIFRETRSKFKMFIIHSKNLNEILPSLFTISSTAVSTNLHTITASSSIGTHIHIIYPKC